jgi:predicted metal-dependent hydrolase
MTSASQLSLFDASSPVDLFAVRVSPRARRLTVRVHIGGRVEVVVPRGVAPNTVRAFVNRNTSWIDRKIAEMGSRVAPVATLPEVVAFHSTGERFCVEWRHAERRALRCHLAGIELEARDLGTAFGLLRDWLLVAARERLTPQLMQLAGELGFDVKGVTIRRQRTRWGSCSSRSKISLNCSLLFMPPEVVRYLMVHELSHLLHMNHSDSFWRAVERHEPNYRSLDRQLTAGWRAVPDWVFKG